MVLTDFKKIEVPRIRSKLHLDFYNHFIKEKEKKESRDTCNENISIMIVDQNEIGLIYSLNLNFIKLLSSY